MQTTRVKQQNNTIVQGDERQPICFKKKWGYIANITKIKCF